MADKDKMSVEEILAACRRMDGSGEGGSGGSAAQDATEPAAGAKELDEWFPEGGSGKGSKETSASSGDSTAPKKKPSEMSVEEILAAARGEKKGERGGSTETPSEPPPAPAKPSPTKKPSEMTVEEMLAAARAEKAKPAAKASPKPAQPAAKPGKPSGAASKAKPAKESGKSAGPLDTASILAAARKPVKRGPMSKEEAAKAGKPIAEAAPRPAVPPMPKKPDFSKPAATKEAAESRRGFFGSVFGIVFGSAMAVGFVSLAVTHVLWVLGFARFMFPNILIEPPTRFKVGFPDVIGPGQVVTKFKAQFGVWIVRNEYEGVDQIYALRSVCTHLGCTPNWLEAEQKFKCPCHGSGFYKTGINFEGPAPRPLERYAITIADDGQLEVDKSRKFQQELGQWADPQSYVPV